MSRVLRGCLPSTDMVGHSSPVPLLISPEHTFGPVTLGDDDFLYESFAKDHGDPLVQSDETSRESSIGRNFSGSDCDDENEDIS